MNNSLIGLLLKDIVAVIIFSIPAIISFARNKKSKRTIFIADLVMTTVYVLNSIAWFVIEYNSEYDFSIIIVCMVFVCWLVLLTWSLLKRDKITLRLAGIILLIAGIIFGAYSLQMDTTVFTDNGYANSIRLMSEKTNHLIISSVICIAGVILIVIPQKKPAELSS